MTETRSALPTFLNTRPPERSQPLTALLSQHGWRVIELPLLGLVPRALTRNEAADLDQLAHAPDRISVIIVVSPTAAELGLAALHTRGITAHQLPLAWLAVGQGTADVLKAAGIEAQLPLLETSEGLIASPLLTALESGQTAMIWRGEGGRELVQQHLFAQGVSLAIINFYQRQLPASSMQFWAEHWGTPARPDKKKDTPWPDIVLLSSGESWRYWQMLAGTRTFQPWFLVLGERLWQQLQPHTARLSLLQRLQPLHILQTLESLDLTTIRIPHVHTDD